MLVSPARGPRTAAGVALPCSPVPPAALPTAGCTRSGMTRAPSGTPVVFTAWGMWEILSMPKGTLP